jgi:hypothetical protein
LDHPRTDYKKISNDQAAELTIYWKENDPPRTIKQVLKAFDIINVDITSEFDLNMKKLKLTVCFLQKIVFRNSTLFVFFNRHNYVIRKQKN